MATTEIKPQIQEQAPDNGAPTLWHPWADFDRFQKAMTEWMSQFFGREAMRPMIRPEGPLMPALNLFKEDSNLVVEMALPGVDKKDLSIETTRDTLTVSGETRLENRQEKDKVFQTELYRGRFRRMISLPSEIVTDKVTAKLDNGILRITMPMANPESMQAKSINVE